MKSKYIIYYKEDSSYLNIYNIRLLQKLNSLSSVNIVKILVIKNKMFLLKNLLFFSK